MLKCKFCNNAAVYRCVCCGASLCGSHIRLQPVCSFCIRTEKLTHRIRPAREQDRALIGSLVNVFWGEPEQVMFGRAIRVDQEPAFIARVADTVAGFISYKDVASDDMLIIALAVLPEYQGCGIGRALVAAVQRTASKESKERLVVATSNDDLPALAFYQRLGFQLFEVAPNAVAAKHGRLEKGVANIPVRDELHLQRILAQRKF